MILSIAYPFSSLILSPQIILLPVSLSHTFNYSGAFCYSSLNLDHHLTLRHYYLSPPTLSFSLLFLVHQTPKLEIPDREGGGGWGKRERDLLEKMAYAILEAALSIPKCAGQVVRKRRSWALQLHRHEVVTFRQICSRLSEKPQLWFKGFLTHWLAHPE